MTEIKDSPLLMTGPNVIATLEGRKTMTRRIVKPQPLVSSSSKILGEPMAHSIMLAREVPLWLTPQEFVAEYCPYKPGDILWIKEGYIIQKSYPVNGVWQLHGEYLSDGSPFHCELTDREWALWQARKYPWRKTPGRFMYKSLARLWREITEIRVERVQEISKKDAIKEGIEKNKWGNWKSYLPLKPDEQDFEGWLDPRNSFMELWDSINGPGAWERNDHCWAISYEEIVAAGMAQPTNGEKTSDDYICPNSVEAR